MTSVFCEIIPLFVFIYISLLKVVFSPPARLGNFPQWPLFPFAPFHKSFLFIVKHTNISHNTESIARILQLDVFHLHCSHHYSLISLLWIAQSTFKYSIIVQYTPLFMGMPDLLPSLNMLKLFPFWALYYNKSSINKELSMIFGFQT